MSQKLDWWSLLLGAVIGFCSLNSSLAQTADSGSSSTNNREDASSRGAITLPREKAAPVSVPRFDRPPQIDGKLEDEVWKQAVKLSDFYQTSPGDNIAPSQPTEVFLGYDSRALYVAFHCYDDPSKAR